MLFSSMTFFYIFLPLVLVIYFAVKKDLRNPVLLIASMIFYGWGEPKYLAVMLMTIVINYFGALIIEKRNNEKFWLFVTVSANLGFLAYFKYFNFLIQNIDKLFHLNATLSDIVLPLGISFYTFQALSYVMDVYRGECKAQKNFCKLALYICLFPQLIAGPIIKYHDIEKQIDCRETDFENFTLGIKRLIAGFAKKVLIANTLGAVADKIFAQSPDTFSHLVAWIGAFAYSFQIYFDFSGYCDMAIGLGLIFGFSFMENFNYPYISKSLTEFWRRWHISLTTWFKQYVYIPLGGNRSGKFKTLRNLLIVFILTGIWHGAQWTFILWGLLMGFFVLAERIFGIKQFEKNPHSIFTNIIMHLYCILVFTAGWVIFRAENIRYAAKYLMNMFFILKPQSGKFLFSTGYYIDNIELTVFICAILCSTPLFANISKIKNKYIRAIVNVWLLVLFFLSTISITGDTYNPFIYFRF